MASARSGSRAPRATPRVAPAGSRALRIDPAGRLRSLPTTWRRPSRSPPSGFGGRHRPRGSPPRAPERRASTPRVAAEWFRAAPATSELASACSRAARIDSAARLCLLPTTAHRPRGSPPSGFEPRRRPPSSPPPALELSASTPRVAATWFRAAPATSEPTAACSVPAPSTFEATAACSVPAPSTFEPASDCSDSLSSGRRYGHTGFIHRLARHSVDEPVTEPPHHHDGA
ncbi:hypothetical protein Hoch_5552 [Haliangium ochraceum DSM 14365]|uniref:Uncharacterized protein n=1 Tax=Haliangium ochraceum (strain DSM 14365 / JCM 11303 / SMP-2) TaxID=502025 RepID=D0LZQ5_HALO1|nr:hypothetical protein Hoch_5552 [Haliangium ochraceum DSM 14365]